MVITIIRSGILMGENWRHAGYRQRQTAHFCRKPMLHWPDSMMTYLTGDAVLSVTMLSVSTTATSICSTMKWSDGAFRAVPALLRQYPDAVHRLVTPKITEILGFNLPVDMKRPLTAWYGAITRRKLSSCTEMGGGLSGRQNHHFLRHHVDNTRMMADAIAQGIAETDPRGR